MPNIKQIKLPSENVYDILDANALHTEDLKSTTKSTLEAASMGSTSGKQYAVGLDKNGDLSVNIPWSNTTYTGSDGVTLTGTNFTNSGVRSIATGSSNGTISVNTNGTSANVAVKGLKNAAYKDVTDTYSSTGTDPATGKAIANAFSTIAPMIYQGTLGTGGTITTLPTAAATNKGSVYNVITNGTYASKSAIVGDMFVSNGTEWVLIPSGDEPTGTVTKVSTGVGLTGGDITTTGTIKAYLKSETKATYDSAAVTNTQNRQYAITPDKTGYLSVNIPWTDTNTKVTSVGNHYAPAEDSSAQLSADASSTTEATWGTTSLVTGVDIKRDAKGHVTGLAVDSIKIPANPNTDTTYTFTNGTNGFTVTPSGGSAQTVTVTPSITNNVTGSGTSGYLAKFNGANTITNGVALGTSTTKYLRNDGTWQVPPNTTYSAGSGLTLSDTTFSNNQQGVYTVIGTQTAATGSWTGVLHGVSSLYDGLTIMYYLPWAGSDNATLNLTLDDGTTTGAINCYYSTGRLTTHYGKGCNIIMTYWSAGSISIDGTATTDDRWIANANYADGNDTAYYLRRSQTDILAGSNKIFPYTIIMQISDGRWESIVTSSSTGTSKARNTHGFRLGQILLMYANATYNENERVANNNLWEHHSGANDHRYSFNTANNATSGTTANKPIYIVGTLNATDGLFYLDSTWWTQTLPSSDDGKLYIYVGDAYDYYRFNYSINHPIYWYKNGAVRQFTQDSATVTGHTVAKDVPSNAVFTDTNNAVTQTATSTNANYEVLFSATADNTTRTEGARKYSNLTFNPSTGTLTATKFSGALTGNVTGNCSGSSGSCTGNAATATSATSATSASRLSLNSITVQTGSSKQQKISLQTLMTWLITTKSYIPSNTNCSIVIKTSWNYDGNDILQLSIPNAVGTDTNYELQLAGVIIEFDGSATSYNTGEFRLRIHSSPTTSFTSTSGYTKFPVDHIAEYTCNGTDYSPAWRMISVGGDIGVNTTSIGSASAGTAIPADDITAWSAGTATSASVSLGVLTITNGTAPSLSYTAKSIPNISVSSKTVVTGLKSNV